MPKAASYKKEKKYTTNSTWNKDLYFSSSSAISAINKKFETVFKHHSSATEPHLIT